MFDIVYFHTMKHTRLFFSQANNKRVPYHCWPVYLTASILQLLVTVTLTASTPSRKRSPHCLSLNPLYSH